MHALAVAVALMLSGGAAGPSLRAADLDPLTLRGTGFRANERVKLLFAGPQTVQSRAVRTNARGRFRVVFRVALGRCDPVVVQALGARGSRAVFRHDVPDCVSP